MTNTRILLVDDDPSLLAGLRRQLGKEFEIATAGDGPSAIAAVRAAMSARMPFAAILCDMRMPGMDGVATLAAIRDLAPDSARLMLTGDADLQTSMEAINKGNILRFYIKPCPIEILREGLLAGVEYYRRATEHVETAEEAKRWAAALAASNAEIEQFAYIAAHDLQEPLRTVTSYVQLLKHRYGDRLGQDADDFINFAVEGTHRMRRLFVDFLTYSEICRQDLRFRAIDMDVVVARALVRLESLIAETGAIVTRGTLPRLDVDEQLAVTLFEHLIGNGIKFRREGIPPEITIDATALGETWLFSVRDNGVGIDTQYRERIFCLFERLNAAEGDEGTGTGLALCKKIVERHGGQIWLEPVDGAGTVFSFTLPSSR